MEQAKRSAPWLPILAIVLLTLALRLPTASFTSLSIDESAYSLVAAEILRGNWPYSHAFDHKPIGIYLHYAGVMATGLPHLIAVRLLAILVAIGSSLFIYAIARQQAGASRGIATGLGLLYTLASIGLEGQPTNTEIIVNFYLFAWLYAFGFRDQRPLASAIGAGIAAGIAVQVNYLAGPVLATLYLGAFIANPKREFRWLLVSGLTSIGTALSLLVPMLLAGTLGEYFAMQASFLSVYRAPRPEYWLRKDLTEIAQVLALPMLLFLGLLVYRFKEVPFIRILLLALGAILMASSSGYFFPHYFLLFWVPFFYLLARAVPLGEPKQVRIAFIAALITVEPAFLFGLAETAKGVEVTRDVMADRAPDGDRGQRMRIAFADEFNPGATSYITCEKPVLYHLFEQRPATRYPFYILHMYPYLEGFDTPAHLAEIRAAAPEHVMVGKLCPTQETQWVREAFADYVEVKNVEGTILYRRPDLVAAR
ncbi:ArnT family glycosyltransferase [Sphingomicrobium sediminis]|uniref:Glycosyltransferase family 39 protein n=1 Tax=Sphingomicrobium sediminis TaxID=2950949 RepID=A0A9X2EH74_9SPHN|nr:glycosyltransferase family 39 protein [Sphingomicrobium sediminis]MCM8557406.1 glycosyltransferase family 39 protein [Sphingomicrobium sediminis]